MPNSVAPRGATDRWRHVSVKGRVGRARRISTANGTAAPAASAERPRQAPRTILGSIMGWPWHVGAGEAAVEPGDDGEHRSHQPGCKAGRGNLLPEFDHQACNGEQLSHLVANRVLWFSLHRCHGCKERFHLERW